MMIGPHWPFRQHSLTPDSVHLSYEVTLSEAMMRRARVFEVFTTIRGSCHDLGAALRGWVAEDASEQPERR